MQSKVSGHWTDDQLIAHLYGVGPEDNHLQGCSVCQKQLSGMVSRREALEAIRPHEVDANVQFLAAQRRQIYAKIVKPTRWWSGAHIARWASAVATLLVLGGGLMIYEQHDRQGSMESQIIKNQISDAQLAEQVSMMAQDAEPQSTAPLKALFEE